MTSSKGYFVKIDMDGIPSIVEATGDARNAIRDRIIEIIGTPYIDIAGMQKTGYLMCYNALGFSQCQPVNWLASSIRNPESQHRRLHGAVVITLATVDGPKTMTEYEAQKIIEYLTKV